TSYEDYQVTIGLDLHQAAAADVHFALAADLPDKSRRFVLRITRSGGALFGTKDADRGAFHPAGEPVPFPSKEWFQDRSPYLEVRFARTGGVWQAWFNGTE